MVGIKGKSGIYERSEVVRLQMSKRMTGRKLSKETKRKMSERSKGRKKQPFTEIHIQNLKISHTGKKQSKEQIERRKKTFKKIKLNQGSKNGSWNGGSSFGEYGVEFNRTLKREIRKRDNYTCQECKNKGQVIHHIDYNKKNNRKNNLIMLCKSCHSRTNWSRKDWTKHFRRKK